MAPANVYAAIKQRVDRHHDDMIKRCYCGETIE